MANGDSGAGGAMWAVSTLLVVVLVLVVLYFGGVLGNLSGNKKSTVDININTPASNSK